MRRRTAALNVPSSATVTKVRRRLRSIAAMYAAPACNTSRIMHWTSVRLHANLCLGDANQDGTSNHLLAAASVEPASSWENHHGNRRNQQSIREWPNDGDAVLSRRTVIASTGAFGAATPLATIGAARALTALHDGSFLNPLGEIPLCQAAMAGKGCRARGARSHSHGMRPRSVP